MSVNPPRAECLCSLYNEFLLGWIDLFMYFSDNQCLLIGIEKPLGCLIGELFPAFQYSCTETGDVTSITVAKQLLAWELLVLRISIGIK